MTPLAWIAALRLGPEVQVDVAAGDPRQRGLADRGLGALAQRVVGVVGDVERELRLPAGRQGDVGDRADLVPDTSTRSPLTIWLALANTARTWYVVPLESTMIADRDKGDHDRRHGGDAADHT